MIDYEKMKEAILSSGSLAELSDQDKPPVPKCDDNQNYVFISYSHKDYKAVYCDLLSLHSSKVRYWYDKDLTPGIGWTGEAKGRLERPNCAGIIFYLSESFAVSASILEEVKFALGNDGGAGKNYFAVSLSDDLPEDIISTSIGSKKRAELDALKIYDKRAHEDILLEAFPNEKTNVVKTDAESTTHVKNLLTAIQRNFNVTADALPLEDNKQMRELQEKLSFARHFAIKNGVLIKYLGEEERVIIPDTVTEIGASSFESAPTVKELVIPESVKLIGENAFLNCKELRSITLGGVETIDSAAFRGCEKLESLTLPDGLFTVGSSAFAGCKSLKTVSGGKNIKMLGRAAFEGCSSLSEIRLSSSLKNIPGYLFSECTSLKSIIIPESVSNIGGYSFNACSSLSTVTVPSGVTGISEGAFKYCRGLKSAVIESGVKSIGDSAFYNCKNMTSIAIPSSITNIGAKAFEYCGTLEDIYYSGTREEWERIKKGDRWELYTPRYTVSCSVKPASFKEHETV